MKSSEPIFKPIFGADWENLPPVMLKHYANKPFCNEVVTADGNLDVMCKWYLKPFFWLFRSAPPYSSTNIPVTVHFRSQENSQAFFFNRIFYFEDRKPYQFFSRMFQVKNNEVMEVMSYGICWHSYYSWENGRIELKHKKYSLRIGKINIPLPLTYLLGRCDAYEIPLDENSFDMCATITHPLLGVVYEYKGRFRI